VARYLNGLVRAAFEGRVVRARPSGQLRVLEIGGGTAGTSSWWYPRAARRSSYLFTDVSDLFLGRAAEKLGAHAFVTYALFDVEKDPASQGLRAASFDLILAANVLHATRDLRATVARVRSLLAPGGLVVLSETTSHPHYFDISTGLIEGWQSFADDLRTDNPLVSAATWVSLLREAGLAEAAAFPADDNPASILGNHVMVALAPGMSRAGASPEVVEAGRSGADAAGAAVPLEPALQELLAAPPGERISLLTDIVRGCVMEVMRLDTTRAPDADRGLIDLGLDSLMAVQLRNGLAQRLGLEGRLPSTLVFEHPTCSAIAAFLERLMTAEDAPSSAGVPGPSSSPARGFEIGKLTEEEAEALLLERLDSLEGGKP
jgi:SAM-dependent methyltransferase/acyl carrier protein